MAKRLCALLHFSFSKLVACVKSRDRGGSRLQKLEMLALVPMKVEDVERLKEPVDEVSVVSGCSIIQSLVWTALTAFLQHNNNTLCFV